MSPECQRYLSWSERSMTTDLRAVSTASLLMVRSPLISRSRVICCPSGLRLPRHWPAHGISKPQGRKPARGIIGGRRAEHPPLLAEGHRDLSGDERRGHLATQRPFLDRKQMKVHAQQLLPDPPQASQDLLKGPPYRGSPEPARWITPSPITTRGMTAARRVRTGT